MVQLINKGGFRERANRSRKYTHSENQQTTLPPHAYTQKPLEPEQPSTTTRPHLPEQNDSAHNGH